MSRRLCLSRLRNNRRPCICGRHYQAYYPVNYEAAAEEMKPCILIRNNEKINRANSLVE